MQAGIAKRASQKAFQSNKDLPGKPSIRPATSGRIIRKRNNMSSNGQRDDSLDKEIEMINHNLNNAKNVARSNRKSPQRQKPPGSAYAMNKAVSMKAFDPRVKSPNGLASMKSPTKIQDIKSPKSKKEIAEEVDNIFAKPKKGTVNLTQEPPKESQPPKSKDEIARNNALVRKENEGLLEKMKKAIDLRFGELLPDLSHMEFVKNSNKGESMMDDNLGAVFDSHNEARAGGGKVCDPCQVPEAMFQKFPMPKKGLSGKDYGPIDHNKAKPIFGDANTKQPGFRPKPSPFEKNSIYNVRLYHRID